MKFFEERVAKFLAVAGICVLTACGQQNHTIVKDIKVESYYDNADIYVSLNAKMDFGAMTLPSVQLPVYHPQSHTQLGSIQMQPQLDGSNLFGIALNVSAISNYYAGVATLPNGGVLPLIGSNKVVEIAAGNGIKVYLTLENGAQAIGVAVPIKSFDSIGSSVGTTAIFPVFTIENIIGAAGLFTSHQSGGNGFGVFADLSQVLDQIQVGDLLSSKKSMMMARVSRAKSSQASLNYSSLETTSSKKKKVDKELYKLHKKRTKLKLR